MEVESRTPKSDLVDEVLAKIEAEPWSFDFFQAVRRLEHLHPDRPRVGYARTFEEEFLHFGQKPTLGFQPSAIADFESETEEDGASRMLVYFLGLFGPNGPMPLDLTEFIIDWSHARSERLDRLNQKTGSRLSVEAGLSTDASRDLERQRLARFFDVFHHRLISFFYRAWAHHEPTVSFSRAEDPFAKFSGSLGGLAGEGLSALDAIPDHAKLYQLGHLANPRGYPEGLEAILEDYFGVQVRVIEFVGQWIEVPEDYRTRLGVANHCLGGEDLPSLWDSENDDLEDQDNGGSDEFDISEVVLGESVWDRRQKFRLRVGPMPLPQYKRFVPGGTCHQELIDWVRNYVGDALAWDVQLVLDHIPDLVLGGGESLGLTTWLPGASREETQLAWTNLDDLIIEPLGVAGRESIAQTIE